MKQLKSLWKEQHGYAVVEATILFPILIMIFAGIVLLAMYLPTRSVLQNATQYAATALATEQSDTWLKFSEMGDGYYWESGARPLPNVYVAALRSFFSTDPQDKAEAIVKRVENDSISSKQGDLEVECKLTNYVVYKEISVTATRLIPAPIDLSLVGFPKQIPITVSSTAVVQNGDEFVRTVDFAADFINYLLEKYNINFGKLGDWVNKAWNFLGI